MAATAPVSVPPPQKRGRGRPKGSKNRGKVSSTWRTKAEAYKRQARQERSARLEIERRLIELARLVTATRRKAGTPHTPTLV